MIITGLFFMRVKYWLEIFNDFIKMSKNSDVVIIAPNKWVVTIKGWSFKLTVRYPNIPWQIITNSKIEDSALSLFSLKDITNNVIASKPSDAAKYLWTTSGIILSISTGESG